MEGKDGNKKGREADKMIIEAASYIARPSVSADLMCMFNNVINASIYTYMYIARIFEVE